VSNTFDSNIFRRAENEICEVCEQKAPITLAVDTSAGEYGEYFICPKCTLKILKLEIPPIDHIPEHLRMWKR
jgi:superfamily II helicase